MRGYCRGHRCDGSRCGTGCRVSVAPNRFCFREERSDRSAGASTRLCGGCRRRANRGAARRGPRGGRRGWCRPAAEAVASRADHMVSRSRRDHGSSVVGRSACEGHSAGDVRSMQHGADSKCGQFPMPSPAAAAALRQHAGQAFRSECGREEYKGFRLCVAVLPRQEADFLEQATLGATICDEYKRSKTFQDRAGGLDECYA